MSFMSEVMSNMGIPKEILKETNTKEFANYLSDVFNEIRSYGKKGMVHMYPGDKIDVVSIDQESLNRMKSKSGQFPVLKVKIKDACSEEMYGYILPRVDKNGHIYYAYIQDGHPSVLEYAADRGLTYEEAVRDVISKDVFNSLRNNFLKKVNNVYGDMLKGEC